MPHIHNIPAGEKITIEGDITVASIEPNAQLIIIDGSLHVTGSIGPKASISVRSTKLRNKSRKKSSVNCPEFPLFHHKLTNINGKYVNGTYFSTFKFAQSGYICDLNTRTSFIHNEPHNEVPQEVMQFEQSLAEHDLKFAKLAKLAKLEKPVVEPKPSRRIHTSAMVYIDQDSGDILLKSNNDNFLKSWLNNTPYSGKEILITPENIAWLDGICVTDPTKHLLYAKELIITCPIPNEVTIESDIEMTFKSTIGQNCFVKSEFSGINAKSIGSGTSITVFNDLNAEEALGQCHLESKIGVVNIIPRVKSSVDFLTQFKLQNQHQQPESLLRKNENCCFAWIKI